MPRPADTHLEEILVTFVEAVLTRLDEERLQDTPLAVEWRALQALDSDEVDFCTAAARLGLDPFAVPIEVSELIVQSAARFSPTLLDDFLDAATPGRLQDEATWVHAHWQNIVESDRPTDCLPSLPNGRPSSQSPAWERGLRDAREFRDLVKAPALESLDVRQWVAIEHVPKVTRSLQGVGAPTAAEGCLVALAEPGSEEGERFAAARALWRFLRPAESREFLVTAARTPTQQAERAFAAELLAPASGVAEMLEPDDGGPIAADDIKPISQHFAVSDWVVAYQLINQLELEVEDLDLRREV